MFEERETVTGEVLQWQWREPPEKESVPFWMPLLMEGCKLKDMFSKDLVIVVVDFVVDFVS